MSSIKANYTLSVKVGQWSLRRRKNRRAATTVGFLVFLDVTVISRLDIFAIHFLIASFLFVLACSGDSIRSSHIILLCKRSSEFHHVTSLPAKFQRFWNRKNFKFNMSHYVIFLFLIWWSERLKQRN